MMKALLRVFIAIAALLSGTASAQQVINCIQATNTPCNTSFNPGNGSQGDPGWLFGGKVNANFTTLAPSFSSPAGTILGNSGSQPGPVSSLATLPFTLGVQQGGTGVTTLAGVLKGNGTGAVGSAAQTDVSGLWTGAGCATGTNALLVNGTCTNPGGGGSGTVNSGTIGQVGYYAATGTAISGETTVTVAQGGLNTASAPSSAQIPIAQGTTSYAPETVGGDATIGTTGTVTVVQVEGAAIPTSATVLGTNGSKQLVAATTQGQGTTVALLDPASPVTKNAAYTFVLADDQVPYLHTDGTPRTWTIPANGSVAYNQGACLAMYNANGAAALTVSITTDTLRWPPTGSTGTRTVTAPGFIVVCKVVSSTEWWIVGGANIS